MAPSSSAKKVAKLASRGKGKKIRFQGGSVFPIAVVLVVVLGLLGIIYGRQSRPAGGVGAPYVGDATTTIDTHWHIAYGIYICDTFQPKLTGTKEETGLDSSGNTVLLNDKFRILGVHSHGDGIIHYHPYSTKASGNRAKLGVFLDVYNVKLTDTDLVLPADQGGDKWSTKTTKCDGKDTELRVRVWPHYDKKDVFHDVVTDFNNIRVTNDGMVMVIAFTAKGADIPQPDWAAQLPTLGANDNGSVNPTVTTTIPVGAVPTTTAVGGSAPASTPATGGTTTGVTTAGGSSAPTTTAAVSTSTTAPASTTTGG
ncbi:MAG: hypothetical protein ACXV5U_09640 [Ilumatobacteraceae bacterium]